MNTAIIWLIKSPRGKFPVYYTFCVWSVFRKIIKMSRRSRLRLNVVDVKCFTSKGERGCNSLSCATRFVNSVSYKSWGCCHSSICMFIVFIVLVHATFTFVSFTYFTYQICRSAGVGPWSLRLHLCFVAITRSVTWWCKSLMA